ncbi:hypothetical protein VN97_g6758 [Penicillium thymicola]|uniref:Uncharacterized protein n=1 Tax=Penicillium thymicola TaxID=293382 RepID=A0AAI9X7F7_PENTH|nr:hypothetical protein VN97_g6758 [Penicillium thymicola]
MSTLSCFERNSDSLRKGYSLKIQARGPNPHRLRRRQDSRQAPAFPFPINVIARTPTCVFFGASPIPLCFAIRIIRLFRSAQPISSVCALSGFEVLSTR